MELKVWVEGIQRIVCGVTDATTCQDIVFALAHATGKTGRFTLIERWRNNERALAPQENPLKILMKWGQYSSDVQFVLQRSEQKQQLQQHPQSKQQLQRQQEKAMQEGNHVRQRSLPSTNPSTMTNSNTNARSNPASPVTSPTLGLYNKRDNMSMPAFVREAETRKSLTTQDRPVVRNLMSPQMQHRPFNPLISPHKYAHSSPGSNHESSPINHNEWHNTSNGEVTAADVRNSLDRKVNMKPMRGGMSSNENLLAENNNMNGQQSPSVSSNGSLVPPPYRDPPAPRSSPLINNKSNPILDQNIVNGRRIDFNEMPNGVNDQQYGQNGSQYRDLVQLIQFQRDKITVQQSDLTKYDAEIVFLENKSREQQLQLEAIVQEINKTDIIYRQGNDQLQTLAYVEEENELVKQQEKTLKSEITLLRSKLANCETELLQCKNKIRLLMDEIHLEQRCINQEFNNRQQMERHLMHEVERIQSDIEIAAQTSEMSNKAAENLKKDVAGIEMAIAEKKKQVEQLVHQMKEVNLQSLAQAAPAEEVKNLIESSMKPGSSRRIIGSPRQLENAVPTSKNPHGVWV
ncbi:ras association domain-containing protein 8 [Culicoides brevitarsis]|uniref:ras association domain-containing protein 8 n=1 Tax=Culicoides brevitarsis TaxID=469753 RepID=UPI00307C66DA